MVLDGLEPHLVGPNRREPRTPASAFGFALSRFDEKLISFCAALNILDRRGPMCPASPCQLLTSWEQFPHRSCRLQLNINSAVRRAAALSPVILAKLAG